LSPPPRLITAIAFCAPRPTFAVVYVPKTPANHHDPHSVQPRNLVVHCDEKFFLLLFPNPSTLNPDDFSPPSPLSLWFLKLGLRGSDFRTPNSPLFRLALFPPIYPPVEVFWPGPSCGHTPTNPPRLMSLGPPILRYERSLPPREINLNNLPATTPPT